MRKAVVVMLVLGVLLWAMTAGVAVAGSAKSGKGHGQAKVALCHKGDRTITVGAPAAKGHFKHGDTAGECAAEETTAPEQTTAP